MKILHIIDSAGLYGAEIMLLSLMEKQLEIGDKPVLCSIGLPGETTKPLELEAKRRGLYVIPIRIPRGFTLCGIRTLLEIARTGNFDVLHSHGYKSDILLGPLTRRFRRLPMITTLHGWTAINRFSKIGIYEWLDCLSLNGVDAIVSVNPTLFDLPVFKLCLNKNRLHIPNGIDPFPYKQPSLDASDPIVSFCQGHFVVGSLGRLSPEKGYDILIRAFKIVNRKIPESRLLIIGEGHDRGRLEKITRELNLDNNILMPGFRAEARRYLRFFSCFVISSYTEGMPISMLEALMEEIPVVSTNVGNINDALDSGETGTLVKPGDIEGLVAAITDIYNNHDLARKKAIAGKARIVSKYSIDSVALKYREVYLKISGSICPYGGADEKLD